MMTVITRKAVAGPLIQGRKVANRALAALGLLLMTACSTNVFVKGDYPSPLGRQMPFTAGLHFDEAFRNYTFERESTEIKFGDAQTRLFQTVFAGMFRDTVQLDNYPDESPAADLVIVPHVEEVQIATPYENRLKVYEVWIKYNMQVFDGDGNAVADWIMTSYGKTPTATLKSGAKSLHLASIVALRDAGARMATGFARVPEIQGWLVRQANVRQTNPDNPASTSRESVL